MLINLIEHYELVLMSHRVIINLTHPEMIISGLHMLVLWRGNSGEMYIEVYHAFTVCIAV